MLESDRLRIAMLLTGKLSVRRIAPSDDDYAGSDGHTEYRIEGVAEAAEELAKERDLLLRLIESASRHLKIARRYGEVGVRGHQDEFEKLTADRLYAAIAILREGKVPEKMREGVG
jgi:hypothetical protein